MTDELEKHAARWRAAQPPAPGLDLDRLTARRPRAPRRRAALAAVAALAVGTGAVIVLGGSAPRATPTPELRLAGRVQPVVAGSTSARQVAQGQVRFGLDLLAARCAEDPLRNDVLSPASAGLALGMLGTGARGDTRSAVDRLLHLPTSGSGLAAAQQQQTAALHGLTQVRVSNHVYTQSGVRPQQATLDELATSYGSDLSTVDFARNARQATDAINADVSRDTMGLITGLFDKPLLPSTTTVLTDAVHLAAPWQQAFGAARSAPFRTADGRQVEVSLMNGQDQPGQRREAGGWTSVTLPYEGGQLEAVVILPPDPATSCQAPTATDLQALTTGPGLPSGIDLPRLHLTQTSDLTGTLAHLGLPLDGDYSGLGAPGAAVSQVVQRTVLDVDENGTTAAAATGVVRVVSARVLAADRPFFVLVRDTGTGTPLFLVHVNDPTAPSSPSSG